MTHPTNATKAQVIALVNAVVALVTAFGLDISTEQLAALLAVVNAALSLWVGLTYKASPKRIPE